MTWANVDASGLLTNKPVLLRGCAITVTETGTGITLYDGQDAESGRKIINLKSLANRSLQCNFAIPLECDRGIYVTVEDGCNEALVYWTSQ